MARTIPRRLRVTWMVGAAVALLIAGAEDVTALDWPEGGPPQGASIAVNVHAAPDRIGGVEIRVSGATGDITESACAQQPSPDLAGSAMTCWDLPDGTFSVEVTSSDPSDHVRVRCVDIVASIGDPASLPLGDGYTDWICDAVVGPPTIQLVGGVRDPFDPVLRDLDGEPVPCVTDSVDFEHPDIDDLIVLWCRPAAGAAQLDPTSIAPGFEVGWFCDRPSIDAAPPIEFSDVIVVDEVTPFARCRQQGPGTAALVFDIEFQPGRDRTWADAIDFDVFTEDGTSVRTDCRLGRGGDFETRRHADWGCFAPIGTVDFDILGLPAGAVVVGQGVLDGDCEALTHGIGIQAICSVRITYPDASVLTPTPPPVELPATGRAMTSALVAAILIGSGLGLRRLSMRPHDV